MIKKISRVEAEKRFHVFPKIRFETIDEEDTGNSKLNLETYVEKDGNLVVLRKHFSYRTELKLDYRQLMQFVDSIQVNVNKFKMHYKPLNLEQSNILGVYKIIE